MTPAGKGGTGSYGIESNPVYGKFRGPHCNVARQGTLAALPPTDAKAKSGSLESASWIWGPISQAGWEPRDTIGGWQAGETAPNPRSPTFQLVMLLTSKDIRKCPAGLVNQATTQIFRRFSSYSTFLSISISGQARVMRDGIGQ
jgi:hypothetical protein